MLSVKIKEVEKSRSYNHIKHFMDINGKVQTYFNCTTSRRLCQQAGKHEANQLDGEQRHTRFDYYENDMPKFGTPGG